MNRKNFQDLSKVRLDEAKALFRSRHYSGAYYLSGYAVECALKACIAKATQRYDFPPRPDVVREMYIHNLVNLVSVAQVPIEAAVQANAHLKNNWFIAKGWSEQSRYLIHDELQSRNMLEAVSDKYHGVLPWIRQYW